MQAVSAKMGAALIKCMRNINIFFTAALLVGCGRHPSDKALVEVFQAKKASFAMVADWSSDRYLTSGIQIDSRHDGINSGLSDSLKSAIEICRESGVKKSG
jgi:hypothetical protein